jgi:two-component system chemotaxis response regulator CheY
MSKVVLAVDDVATMRQMVASTLRDAGYEVIEAANATEALTYASEHAVDLVLADLYMPGLDGIGLIRELRALPAYRLTPMLLLTTESSPLHKMQAKQAGATGWMVKPFRPKQLLLTLERALGVSASGRVATQ